MMKARGTSINTKTPANTKPPKNYDWLKFILSHLLAFITGTIGLLYWFTYRQLVNLIMINSSISIWAWEFIDLVSFLFYGVVWLISVLACQYFYEKDLKKRLVPRSFIYITILQLLFFGGSHLAIILMVRAMES